MLHIYRQITSLRRVQPAVVAQKREEADRFPFDDVTVIGKPPTHFLRRIWYRQLRDAPWQLSRGEVQTLRGLLDRKNARLLHVYFGHIAVHLLPLMREWNKPTVVSFHGADVMVDLHKPAYKKATAAMLDAARLVLVRSESLGRALAGLGCDEAKIRIQRTGIPLSEFAYRSRQWLADGSWRLVQACRLIPKKGLGTTLKAFAQFIAAYPNARLIVAGEGPLLPDLQQLARDLGIEHAVSFPGFLAQEELRELFYNSHLFLHPSELGADGNQEGVPNSMLEAMATGLPVVATLHGGIPEAVENGESGVLVPEGDTAAIASALLDLTKAPQALESMSLAARRAVETKFDRAAQTRHLEDLYFEAMGVNG